MGGKLTAETWVQKARETHGDRFDYSKVNYEGSKVKIEIGCYEHGSFWQLPAQHVYGSGCPSCVQRTGAPIKRTFSSFLEEAAPLHPDVTFKRMRKATPVAATHQITATCKTHGVFSRAATEILRGWGCPTCCNAKKGRPTKRQDALVRKIEKIWGVTVEYAGKNSEVLYHCATHGSRKARSLKRLMAVGCGACATAMNGKAKRYTHQQFVALSTKAHRNKYTYPAEYEHSKEKIGIECPKHGRFYQEARYHMAGQGCPTCAAEANTSTIERRVGNWISKHVRVERAARILDGKDIDIWCPEQQIGVEVNGVYWHSEKFKPKHYHQEKATLASSKDIRLLQFWEHELKEKARVCKSMLRSALGLCDRYYARELEIRRLSKQARWFAENHLQGGCSAEIAYGLFNGGACLCAMSFGKPRFNKTYEWELLRFANRLNTTVVGGASRLFMHFLKEHSPATVLSYADLRISNGNLYRQLGFDLSHTSAPNYFWCKGARSLKRYQTQKHKLGSVLGPKFAAALSEAENMHNNGWLRTYDAGNLVFVWRSNNAKIR